MSPDVLVQGTSVSGVLVTAEEPIFSDPAITLSFGAGVLITKFAALDDFTALVDVKINPRAPLEGRAVATEKADFGRMGVYDIIGPGAPKSNTAPVIKIGVPIPTVTANQPFNIGVAFDDADGDYVEVFLAIKDLITDQIIYRSRREVHDTAESNPFAEQAVFTVPGFPAGPYKAVVEADDGIAFFVIDDRRFTISPDIREPEDSPRNPGGPDTPDGR